MYAHVRLRIIVASWLCCVCLCARASGTANRQPDIYCCQTKRLVPLLIKAKIHQSTNPTTFAHGWLLWHALCVLAKFRFLFSAHQLAERRLFFSTGRVLVCWFLPLSVHCLLYLSPASPVRSLFGPISTSAFVWAARVWSSRVHFLFFSSFLCLSVFLFVFIKRKLLPYK